MIDPGGWPLEHGRMRLHHPTQRQIDLAQVLGALAHPVRLAIVMALKEGNELPCGRILPSTPKSTLTRHWRVLREAGLIRQKMEGREFLVSLRATDLEERFPGLIGAVLGSSRSTLGTRRT